MTLLNHNLFSKENFASLAKSLGHGGNNSHKAKAFDSHKPEQSKTERTAPTLEDSRQNKPKISQNKERANSSFESEVQKASAGRSESGKQKVAEEKHTDNSSDLGKSEQLQAKADKLQNILQTVKNVKSQPNEGDDSIISSILTDEELSLLKDLGLGTDEAVFQFLSSQKDGLDLSNPKFLKALNILQSNSNNLIDKLSSLSGISQEELGEMIDSLIITKGEQIVEFAGKAATNALETENEKTGIDLLSLLSGKTLNKSEKKDKRDEFYLIKTDGGNDDGNSQSANISQSFFGFDMPKDKVEKFIADISKNNQIGNLSSKGSKGQQLNSPSIGKEASVFRNVRLDNVIGTTTRLVSQMKSGDTTSARMHLNPRSLGTVFVEIHLTGETADIRFRTESAEAGKALESQIANLKEQLQKEGIKTGNIQYTQDGQDMQQFSQNGNNSREEMESRKDFIGYDEGLNGAGETRQGGFAETLQEGLDDIISDKRNDSIMTGRSL